MVDKQRRRVVYCLLVSFLLHLLVILTGDYWVPREIQEELFRVKFPEERTLPHRFELAPNTTVPRERYMERLVFDDDPQATSVSPFIPPPDRDIAIPREEVALERPRLQGEKSEEFVAPQDSLPTLEDLNMVMVERRIEELGQYERLWMPDADRGDEDSELRQQAQEVVMRAVEAMGGVEALSQIRDMAMGRVAEVTLRRQVAMERSMTAVEVQERLAVGRYFYKSYDLRSKYAQYLPGGGRLVYDGVQAWIDIKGVRHQVEGEQSWVIQNRAERWDFLSRYLGDGVQVSYMGLQESNVGKSYHVVEVVDLKFGSISFRALFDARTHLPVAEEYPIKRPELRKRFLAFEPVKDALLWTQVETTRLNARRGAKDTLAVNYAEISDEVFELLQRQDRWEKRDKYDYNAKLWVDVDFGNQSYNGVPVVTRASVGMVDQRTADGARAQRDTSKYLLNYKHVQTVAGQIEQVMLEEMQKRELFAQVSILESKDQVGAEDYILRMRPLRKKRNASALRGDNYYGAELYSASANSIVMRDGPLPANYMRRECFVYRMPIFIVEDSGIAYVSDGRMRELLTRSYTKMSNVMDAVERGEAHLPHNNECCYCQVSQ